MRAKFLIGMIAAVAAVLGGTLAFFKLRDRKCNY